MNNKNLMVGNRNMINKLKGKTMCVVWLDKTDIDFIESIKLDSKNIDENMKQVGDIIINARETGRIRYSNAR